MSSWGDDIPIYEVDEITYLAVDALLLAQVRRQYAFQLVPVSGLQRLHNDHVVHLTYLRRCLVIGVPATTQWHHAIIAIANAIVSS